MKRQSHTEFTARYLRLKAALQETEGEKLTDFKRSRALARDADNEPAKRERKGAASHQHHQQGSL
jgi:hypothetical protein